MPMYNNPAAMGLGYNNFMPMPGGPMGQPAPRYEIIHVNGSAGANSLRMAPNSQALVLDDTAPLVWLCQTDGAGYLSAKPFDIAPHQAAPAVDPTDLDRRITRLEEILNGKQSHDALPGPAPKQQAGK